MLGVKVQRELYYYFSHFQTTLFTSNSENFVHLSIIPMDKNAHEFVPSFCGDLYFDRQHLFSAILWSLSSRALACGTSSLIYSIFSVREFSIFLCTTGQLVKTLSYFGKCNTKPYNVMHLLFHTWAKRWHFFDASKFFSVCSAEGKKALLEFCFWFSFILYSYEYD